MNDTMFTILMLYILIYAVTHSTADFCRRRYDQYRRVIELEKATQHITPPPDLQQSKWGRVQWYYRQYGTIACGIIYLICRLRCNNYFIALSKVMLTVEGLPFHQC